MRPPNWQLWHPRGEPCHFSRESRSCRLVFCNLNVINHLVPCRREYWPDLGLARLDHLSSDDVSFCRQLVCTKDREFLWRPPVYHMDTCGVHRGLPRDACPLQLGLLRRQDAIHKKWWDGRAANLHCEVPTQRWFVLCCTHLSPGHECSGYP